LRLVTKRKQLNERTHQAAKTAPATDIVVAPFGAHAPGETPQAAHLAGL